MPSRISARNAVALSGSGAITSIWIWGIPPCSLGPRRWAARRATKGGSSASCPFAASSRKRRKARPKAAGESAGSSLISPPSQRVVAGVGLLEVAGEEVYGRLHVVLVHHLVRGVDVAAGGGQP